MGLFRKKVEAKVMEKVEEVSNVATNAAKSNIVSDILSIACGTKTIRKWFFMGGVFKGFDEAQKRVEEKKAREKNALEFEKLMKKFQDYEKYCNDRD